jgi:hypothetical protein
MSSFSRLFSTMAERWPAASRCLEEYERLLAPVRKDYAEFVMQQTRTQSIPYASADPERLGDLDDLVDPASNLDEIFDYGSFFHPAESSQATEHSWYPVPINWNTEFDFEINQ